jgi:hypothetical protein
LTKYKIKQYVLDSEALGDHEFEEEEVHRGKTEKENPKASADMVNEPETRKPLSSKAAAAEGRQEARENNTAPSGVMEIEKVTKTVAPTNILPPRKTEGTTRVKKTVYWQATGEFQVNSPNRHGSGYTKSSNEDENIVEGERQEVVEEGGEQIDMDPKKTNRKTRGWVGKRDDGYQWENVEVKDAPPEHGGRRGVYVREEHPGLDHSAKFEYGGRKIGEEEFLRRSQDPELNEYLLEVQDAEGGKIFIDAHPRLLEEIGVNPYLWIGAFCNQANTPAERNAQISYISKGEQKTRPRREHVDDSITICIRIVKPVGRGQQILVNYGYDIPTQLERGLGYTFFYRIVQGNTEGEPAYDSNSSPDEKGQSATIPEASWRHYRMERENTLPLLLPQGGAQYSSTHATNSVGMGQLKRKQTPRMVIGKKAPFPALCGAHATQDAEEIFENAVEELENEHGEVAEKKKNEGDEKEE